MKLYLAGPMNGIEKHNYPAFSECAEVLRAQGYEIVSPAELHPEAIDVPMDQEAEKRAEYLSQDFQELIQCDGVAAMGGFATSSGSMWELHTALLFRMPVYLAPNMYPYDSEQVRAFLCGHFQPTVDNRLWINMFNARSASVFQNAIDKGFWDEPRNDGEIIALMHSELSEVLEAIRKGNPADDKLPEYSGVETELADVIIRIMDYSAARNLRVAEAIEAKMDYNTTRPHKHGKAF